MIRALVAALAFIVGCGSSESATASGGTGGSGGAPPVLDPALFDCSVAATPERATEVPPSCALDAACTTKLVSGHRGVGGELGVIAPEDTLAAVRAAIALGVDFVETDPRPTKDGALVNMHDPEVDRTTDGTGAVDTMTLAEVQALHIDAAKYAGDLSCERVPTLAEVLAEAKGKVHVLVDANKTDRVDLLVGAVQDTGTLDWAIFDTDSVEKIDQALALEPGLAIQIRVADPAELDAELQHFATHPPVLVELHDGASAAQMVPLVHAAKKRALNDTFVVDVAAGLDGDEQHYAEIFDTGVDVAQTDRPDLVLRYLGR